MIIRVSVTISYMIFSKISLNGFSIVSVSYMVFLNLLLILRIFIHEFIFKGLNLVLKILYTGMQLRLISILMHIIGVLHILRVIISTFIPFTGSWIATGIFRCIFLFKGDEGGDDDSQDM